MFDMRTYFVVWAFLYLTSVDGFPIYGELDVNVSNTKKTWREAEAECQKDGQRLTNYLTVESLSRINISQKYWIGGQENDDCLMLSKKHPETDDCSTEHFFICSPKEIANMNHVIMIAVGVFTIINMILVTICVLRRLCKRRARLPKEEKSKATTKKDKKEQKKKDKRQKKDAKVADETKQDTAAAGDAEAPKQAGDDAQAQTTAVVEAGTTGMADVATTSTTPVDAEAGKEEKLPDPPEFILNDTTSVANTTVGTDPTAASVAVVASSAAAAAAAAVAAVSTGAVDTGIVSSTITTTGANVDSAKEADKDMSSQEADKDMGSQEADKDMGSQEAGKDDPGKAVVTSSRDTPSLMAEVDAMLQSTASKQGEATPIETPLPPPPEELLKSDTTTAT